jgi:hypothetical protein
MTCRVVVDLEASQFEVLDHLLASWSGREGRAQVLAAAQTLTPSTPCNMLRLTCARKARPALRRRVPARL